MPKVQGDPMRLWIVIYLWVHIGRFDNISFFTQGQKGRQLKKNIWFENQWKMENYTGCQKNLLSNIQPHFLPIFEDPLKKLIFLMLIYLSWCMFSLINFISYNWIYSYNFFLYIYIYIYILFCDIGQANFPTNLFHLFGKARPTHGQLKFEDFSTKILFLLAGV